MSKEQLLLLIMEYGETANGILMSGAGIPGWMRRRNVWEKIAKELDRLYPETAPVTVIDMSGRNQ